MKKILTAFFTTIICFSGFAKTSNPLCNGVTGPSFTSGNGSPASPYLICNTAQFARLSTETPLLSSNFKLGADLSFLGVVFNIIGSDVTPFQGIFNGDGYSLLNITLTIPSGRVSNIGPFGYLNNAAISNLNINSLTINAASTFQQVGGVAGFAQNSTISNVQIVGLNILAPTRTGGVVGYAVNCTIQNCSTNGTLTMYAYSYGVAGLIGRGDNSHVSASYSNVTINLHNNSYYFGNKVGGLFGYLVNTQVNDVYSQGSIDFTNVASSLSSSGIGGIVGVISGGTINNAYFAGTMLHIQGTDVGGAIGSLTSTNIHSVLWNQITSQQNSSAGGTGSTTCLMTNSVYWTSLGFNSTTWTLSNGLYPKLSWQP